MVCNLSGHLLLVLLVLLNSNAHADSDSNSDESASNEVLIEQERLRLCAKVEGKYLNKFGCLGNSPSNAQKCQKLERKLVTFNCKIACDRSSVTEDRECVASSQICQERQGLCLSGQKCCLAPPAFTCDQSRTGVTCESASTCPSALGQSQESTLTCPGTDVCCVRACPTDAFGINCGAACDLGYFPKTGFACQSASDTCCEIIGPGP